MLVIPNKDGTYPEGEEPSDQLKAEAAEEEGAEASEESEPEPQPEPEVDYAAQLAEERERRIRLEERLRLEEERRTKPAEKKPEPQVFTRQQLRAAVNEGTIDEDQMEEIWAKQQREQTVRETQRLIEERERVRNAETTVDSEMDKYIAAYPDVKKVGSELWRRVKREYDFLIKIGDADSKTTELKALRAAFGSPDRIPDRTAARRETPGDSSGSQGGGGDRPVDIWNRVPKHLRPYYKDQVAQGFKTLEDVKKDIPYMSEKH